MKYFTLFFLLCSFCSISIAQTNVSGNIPADSVWDLSGSPYIVTGNISINSGVTLTVKPSVVVRFINGTSMYVNGTLKASNATFTSSADTSGGSPQKGNWGYIRIGYYNIYGNAVLDTCQIKYGGSASSTNIYVYNGSLSMSGSYISNSIHNGITVGTGKINLNSVNISNCNDNGIIFNGNTQVELINCSVSGCDWPLRYTGTASLIFNGVNSISGNTHDGIYLNFTNTNTMVLDTIDVPYYCDRDFNVNPGDTLTIASTDVMKFSYGRLNVNGALIAKAGAGEKIHFTSYKNDNLFGDTNGDGTATNPASSDWGGVVFNNSSIDSASIMYNCDISFAGRSRIGGVTMYNASPTIDSCDFANNYYGVMMQDVSNPVFTNNIIGSSEMVPIAISFAANPVFQNNSFSFSDNQYDAIGLLGGTLAANSHLPIRSVTSIPNVTYLLLESVIVPEGKSLTIDKGIVIKGYSGAHRIIVKGKLTADGTADSMIVFTSVKDDNFGNPDDTNKDGSQTTPSIGDWGGITFEAGSDSSSILNYCRIKYGNVPGSSYYFNRTYYGGGAVTIFNSNPTISNCEIKDENYALYIFQSAKPKILNNQIINTSKTPIAMSVSTDPTFSGNTFTNTTWTALGIIGEYVGADGIIKERTVAGFTNITYLLLGDITINSGTNVTVAPGVVIKSDNPGIYVDGGFKAKGDAAHGTIVFTSMKDDNFGNPGDTNGDGSASSPKQGDWSNIQFRATSNDAFCLLDSCLIKFGGNRNLGGVAFTDAGTKFSNSTISDSYTYGVRCEGSANPVIDGVSLINCRLDPIAMSLKSNPTFSNITFSANGTSGIRILEGTLSSDATLAKRNVAGINNIAYLINGLTINPNAVLTIEPGVVIKFSNSYDAITVQGGLIADGTATQNIIFTSIRDDSNGGDTNNDGNGSVPGRGNWNTLVFTGTSNDSLNSLKHCQIRYGGSGSGANYNNYGALRIYNTKVVVDSCVIEQANHSGIGIYGSAYPVISNTQINNISLTPISMSMFANPIFNNNTALNVGYMAIGIAPETYSLDATIPIRNFGGYNNITYYLFSNCKINSGTTIKIPAGLIFKGAGFDVNGSLIVEGTETDKVVFTDIRDDDFGNPHDTNLDGNSTKPTISSYSKINFADVSNDSLSSIRYAIIRYKDGGINLEQASPNINNCTFEFNNWGVYLNGVSTPAIDSCKFDNLTYAPIRTSLVSYPRSTLDNSLSGSTYKAIGVLSNETLVQDVTLIKHNFCGIENIPYLFGNYTIASNSILTISPGVRIKFFAWTGLSVKKGLIAEGGSTPDSVIVFTDVRDDYYSGDTNSDSTNSNPYSSYSGWNGITFQGESLDPLCKLKNCVIRFAGLSNNGSAITANNSSPTITNSSITQNGYGIVASGASNPVINYCDIYDNSKLGVYNIDKSFNIDARWNWWGNNSGPTHSSNPGGSGQEVSDMVNFNPWLGSGASNPIIGDVSLNGAVQSFDASLILKYIVNPHGADSLNEIQQKVADVSANGLIQAYDASLILQYVVGSIEKFPASQKISSPGNENSQIEDIIALQKVQSGQFYLDNVKAKYGDEISIPVYVKNIKGMSSAQLSLTYDPSIIKITSIQNSDVSKNMSIAIFDDSQRGKINIAMAGNKIAPDNGKLLILNVKISDKVKGEVTSFINVNDFIVNEKDLKNSASAKIEIAGLPDKYSLYQNYPNPFNPSTTIQYDIPDDVAKVNISIYNSLGQLIKTLVNATQKAGSYKAVWNGTDNHGVKVSSGMYIYRMSSGSKFVKSKKLLLIK